jgi:isoquinoline 1-oxidoreductase subunit alpha
MPHTLQINGRAHTVDAPAEMPLLWAVRDLVGLTGTKFGCGVAQCGACTVLVDGKAVRSCVMPIAAIGSQAVTTIEGLAADGKLSAVQQAWMEEQVPQCGYCQSGMIMAVTALLAATPKPTDAQLDETLTNICRCGTYPRIRTAVHRAAGQAVRAAQAAHTPSGTNAGATSSTDAALASMHEDMHRVTQQATHQDAKVPHG